MTTMMQAPSTATRKSHFQLPEDADIMARVARIKGRWSAAERQERAETGRHRRAVLAALVESAMVEPELAEVY